MTVATTTTNAITTNKSMTFGIKFRYKSAKTLKKEKAFVPVEVANPFTLIMLMIMLHILRHKLSNPHSYVGAYKVAEEEFMTKTIFAVDIFPIPLQETIISAVWQILDTISNNGLDVSLPALARSMHLSLKRV